MAQFPYLKETPISTSTPQPPAGRTRVNDAIRISPIRLIGADGSQVGIISLEEAKKIAEEAALDLVEVAPDADPPVVRVMDWGKHLYEEQKKTREARKKQHQVTVKEIYLRPGTEKHDLETKLRHVRRFLEEGDKVRVGVKLRGRELGRPESVQEMLDNIVSELEEEATVESRDRGVEGKQIGMVLVPKSSSGRSR